MVKRYKKDSTVSYALGFTLTFELMNRKPEKANRVYFHTSIEKNEAYYRLCKLCDQHNVEMVTSDKPFHILSQKENCYVIGEFEKFKNALEADKPHVVLVNPSNAGNLGTIMRSALGFDVKNLAIIRPAVDIYEPKTVRASMGAVFGLNCQYFDTFEEYQNLYEDHDMYPFMLKATKTLHEIEPKEKFSLIFGNEATGLPDSFLEVGTSTIIPHSHNIDSLNLPIAASIALYEATKSAFKR